MMHRLELFCTLGQCSHEPAHVGAHLTWGPIGRHLRSPLDELLRSQAVEARKQQLVHRLFLLVGCKYPGQVDSSSSHWHLHLAMCSLCTKCSTSC